MTVSSSTNKVSYAGNGLTLNFAVNYYFLENSHLKVILRSADGTETEQTLTTNYTVTGAGNPAGGTVSMLVAPPSGSTLVIVRNVPATQETDYLANDPFPAESHERALDKLTMIVQQQSEVIGRGLLLPITTPTNVSNVLQEPQPNKLLAWNSNGTQVVNFDPADVVTVVGQQNSYADIFTGNGVDVNFTLTRNPGSVFNIDVSVQGVTQAPNVDYTLSGTTLTFTTAPPSVASKILARYSEVYALTDGDAVNVRYLPAGTGAVPTNVQAKLRETVSVKDFGAVGDNVTDDTAAIQAAYDSISATGGTIWWPDGTYKTSASIVVYSNTTTLFSSGAAIDPVALANFQPIIFPTYTFGYALFINENFTTSTFDANITYINVRMIPSRKDFTWSQGVSWNGHGIDARNVQNLKILNSYGENLADFCGVLRCNEVLVQGNWATGMSNSTYDFWEGCQRVRLLNNTALETNNSTNFNAVDTLNSGSFFANDFLCEGNHFEGGPGAAIFIAPLNSLGGTASISNVKIVNNTIDQLNLTTPGNPNGINIQATSNCIVSNNTLRRIGAGFSPIFVGSEQGVLSDDVSICNNVIQDSALVSTSYITAFGTNHYISGNQDVNSSAVNAAYINIDSPTTIVMPQQFTGLTTNYVLNATNLGVPTTPAFEFRTFTSQDQWYVRQGVRTDDGFKHSTAYAITATGTNQATAFALTAEFNWVSNTPVGTGVKLPLGNAKNIGMEVMVFNQGGQDLIIYPAAGDTIGGGNQTISTSTKMKFVCITTNLWVVSGT